jgi:hypothetical protein
MHSQCDEKKLNWDFLYPKFLALAITPSHGESSIDETPETHTLTLDRIDRHTIFGGQADGLSDTRA